MSREVDTARFKTTRKLRAVAHSQGFIVPKTVVVTNVPMPPREPPLEIKVEDEQAYFLACANPHKFAMSLEDNLAKAVILRLLAASRMVEHQEDDLRREVQALQYRVQVLAKKLQPLEGLPARVEELTEALDVSSHERGRLITELLSSKGELDVTKTALQRAEELLGIGQSEEENDRFGGV
jgi:hypothetical protein